METEKQLESKLVRLRQAIMKDGITESMEKQIAEEIMQAKRDLIAFRNTMPTSVGAYSGLNRKELCLTGTCETDWF
jgi:hypothetical protein